MTDKDIINNIERCIENDCDNCTWMEQTACKEYMLHDAFDLLNRQQAEIDRLNSCVMSEEQVRTIMASQMHIVFKEELKTARAEAITDFAEKLKKTLTGWASRPTDLEIKFAIDKVANEMVGAGNG